MKIPKVIEKKLEQRMKAQEKANELSEEIDEWLVKHGADLCDAELNKYVVSGCCVFCEPRTTRFMIAEYIRDKM